MLLNLNEKNKRAFEKAWLGKMCEVLFEEKAAINGQDYYVGYTKEYIKAAMLAVDNLENQILRGKLYLEDGIELPVLRPETKGK